jgi:SPP1 gp7 family putative phage head morphogenesis protein
MLQTQDRSKVRRETKIQRARFAKTRYAEQAYAISLRKIARHCGEIIKAFPPLDPATLPELRQLLTNYAQLLDPWARVAARRFLDDVARRDERAWTAHSREMAHELREELRSVNLQPAMNKLLAEQVQLITSIPLEASQRVHKLTLQALASGERPASLIDEIMKSGDVAVSRATLIARTETSRTATILVRTRAEHIGSTHYMWMAVPDKLTRPMHRKLDGKVFAWTDPPIAEVGGQRHAPGEFPNCRCWPVPLYK